METKSKSFLYKRANFLMPVGPKTLQTLLKEAVASNRLAKQRRENPAADSLHFRLINSAADRGTFFGCEVFSYTKGADFGALNPDDDHEELPVDVVKPPTEGHEFIEGTAYFGAVGNHVVVVQSAALRMKELEDHLNWFLTTKSNVLNAGNLMSLDDGVPPEALSMSDVRGLEVWAPVKYKAEAGDEFDPSKEKQAIGRLKKEESKENRKSMLVNLSGKAWSAFQAFLGDDVELPNQLSAEDLIRTGRMNISMKLTWTARGAGDAAEFMQDVANKLRHVDDELDYSVKTKSGDLGKKDFKVKGTVGVRWGDFRPDFDDLFTKMNEWLAHLQESGKISV